MIRWVESGTVRVENAHGAPPSIPFWNGEGLGRTVELSHEVAVVRAAIDTRADAFAWLEEHCAFTRPAAEQAVAYIRMGKAILGAVPTETWFQCNFRRLTPSGRCLGSLAIAAGVIITAVPKVEFHGLTDIRRFR